MTTNSVSWAAENPLTASTDLSNEGYFVLSWDTGDESASLILEQSSSSDFSDVIRRDISGVGALTITGLDDGDYFFRLSDDGVLQTMPLTISVAHHSLARAGGFFLLGLMLFSTLVFTILNGNRRAQI